MGPQVAAYTSDTTGSGCLGKRQRCSEQSDCCKSFDCKKDFFDISGRSYCTKRVVESRQTPCVGKGEPCSGRFGGFGNCCEPYFCNKYEWSTEGVHQYCGE